MKSRLRVIGLFTLVLLISAPVSIVATIFLLPFWRWVETISGIESIGHSGPAEWCYLAMFALVFLGSLLILWLRKAGR